MTNTTIENQALSIQLNDSESVTVPTGEVWKVTVTGRSASVASDASSSAYIGRFCKINGTEVASSESKSDSWEISNEANASANASSTFPFDTVLVGGDVIKSDGSELDRTDGVNVSDLNVSGFVVN